MNFDLTDEQNVLADLAQQIFHDLSTIERIADVQAGDGFDRQLWNELAKVGLLGLCVPEEYGGLAMNAVELSLVLENKAKLLLKFRCGRRQLQQ